MVGLTGGIASGKTTVVGELRALGAAVIDADRISREIMRPKSSVWEKTIAVFGDRIRKRDNTINRRELGAIIFHNRAKRKALERITHPAILREIRARAAELRDRPGTRLVVIDAPLLFEAGLDREVDHTVVVWVPYAVQLERLQRRDGLTKEEAAERIAAQWTIDKKRKRADHVIAATASRRGVRRQVKKLWGGLTKISKSV